MKKYITASGILIGFIIVLQYNSNLLAHRMSNINEEADKNKIFNELQIKQNKLQEKLDQLSKEESEKEKYLDINLQQELEESKRLAGKTEVEGSGLIIRYAASSDINNNQLAYELQDLTNFLLSLNVEAISINGYRVVFNTPITSIGESILLKNFYINSPFEFQIIGNADFILSAIETKSQIEHIRKLVNDNQRTLEVQIAKKLIIPPHLY